MSFSLFGRGCPRPWSSISVALRAQQRHSLHSSGRSAWTHFRPPPAPRRSLRQLAANASAGAAATGLALSPAVFVSIGETERSNDDKMTGEQYMLEASRAEVESQTPAFLSGSRKWRLQVYHVLDAYIWEPLCTGVRFLHLVLIFVPVIVTVPLIWIGSRNPERDNERSGTLWWYGFLSSSMGRAGAAFIKVRICCSSDARKASMLTASPAWPVGCVEDGHLPEGDVQHHGQPPL